jgi:hypothetical protein
LTFSSILFSIPVVMSREINNLTELVNEILQSEGPYIDDEQKTICRVRDLWLLLGKLLDTCIIFVLIDSLIFVS